MTRAETFTKYFLGFLTIFVVIALYAPIVLTIFYSFYKTRKGKVDWDSFSYEPYTKLIFEKQILERLLSTKIKVFSFHNPSKKILKYNNFKYANMINVYSKFLKENIHYCSDSNGYWRFQKLEDFLDKNYKKIQVTTHPGWWTLNFMKPRQKIKRCIDGRAINCLKSYDKILFDTGRKNIR